MTTLTTSDRLADQECNWMLRAARAPRLRGLREFAEAEVVIPQGPHEGRRFRIETQPFMALWFAEVESGRWSRANTTGPSQSGKTLMASQIPLLYHLFEIGETVIYGVPDLGMARDKWMLDLLPIIECSRYRDMLPRMGRGSRGAAVEAIQFRNGRMLRFMSGKGDDKVRAGFTARVLIITETDGMDLRGAGSREADKISQLEARTRAYGDRRRVYLECTATTEEGRTWDELKRGSDSRIMLPCPHCRAWVSPEREHLRGWREAASKLEARQAAHFACPQCGAAWTEEQRREANLECRLLHRGQSLDGQGQAIGDFPQTDTLGFRWSAVNNLLISCGDIGADEWAAAHAPDEDTADRMMRQQIWCLPWMPPLVEAVDLDRETLQRRVSNHPRGLVPAEAERLTAAIDLGKWLAHYMVIAWGPAGSGWIVDYEVLEINTDSLGVERGTYTALQQFMDLSQAGWARSGEEPRKPDAVWVDSGYDESRQAVYQFCRTRREIGWLPVKGHGRGGGQVSYFRPKKTGTTVALIGTEYHIARVRPEGVLLAEVNADHWKGWLHQRLAGPADQPGALLLFQAAPNSHLKVAQHLTAERKVEEFLPGRGQVTRWDRIRRANHWLDCAYMCCAAGHFVGVRLREEQVAGSKPAPPSGRVFRTPRGEPYLVTER